MSTPPQWDHLPYRYEEVVELSETPPRRRWRAWSGAATVLAVAAAAVLVVQPWTGDSAGITTEPGIEDAVSGPAVTTAPSTLRLTSVVTTTRTAPTNAIDVLAAEQRLDDGMGDSVGITSSATTPNEQSELPTEPVAATTTPPSAPASAASTATVTSQPAAPASTKTVATTPKPASTSSKPTSSTKPSTSSTKPKTTTLEPDEPSEYLSVSAAISGGAGAITVTVTVDTNAEPVSATLHTISEEGGEQSVALSGAGTWTGTVQVGSGPVEWWVATTAGALSYTTTHSTVTIP